MSWTRFLDQCEDRQAALAISFRYYFIESVMDEDAPQNIQVLPLFFLAVLLLSVRFALKYSSSGSDEFDIPKVIKRGDGDYRRPILEAYRKV